MENKLPAGLTPEMIEKLKQEYGTRLRIADLPRDEYETEFLPVIVCVPDRKTVNEFEKWVDSNPGKAKEIVVNTCLLTHKEEVKADDGLWFAAVNAICSLFPLRKAVVRNL